MQYLLEREKPSNDGAESYILKAIFDIDPSISRIPDEQIEFAKYLKQRALTIDIWDANSLLHFGTTKVPLKEMMR
jgi:hypothetical protein